MAAACCSSSRCRPGSASVSPRWCCGGPTADARPDRMPHFVELWIYLSATPLFGLTATLVVYLIATAIYARLGGAPWANPVLWSVVVLASGLLLTRVDYQTYFAGAQFIHFLLGPAVVALAWPLWQR